MLDEISGALLAALNEYCEGGGFKIVEEADLLRLVPATQEELSRRMSYLEDKRFIELRYAEDGAYCVRILPAGRGYGLQVKREQAEKTRSRRDLFFASALGAFAGGALSGTIVLLLSLLV